MRNRHIITAAVRQCVIDWPRLATTLLRLDPREKPGIKTIAVDQHLRLYYDPDWIDEQTFDELVFFIKQEVIHPLLGHAGRSQKILGSLTGKARKYVQEKINTAADCAVYGFMRQEQQFVSSKAANPHQCTSVQTGSKLPEGLSLEEYFVHLFDKDELERLLEEKDDTGNQNTGGGDEDSSDEGGTGPLVSGHNGGSGADGEERSYEDDYEPEKLGENKTHGPSSGVSEGDLDQLSDDFVEGSGRSAGGGHGRGRRAGKKKPRLTPEQLIRMAVNGSADKRSNGFDEPTYRRSSRRHHDSELIRPSYQRRSPSLTVVVDTSASMRQSDVDLAAGVLEVALKGMELDSFRVVMADHEIQTNNEVSSLSQIEFVGGGGTSMDDVCNEIAEKHASETDLLICVTDGETKWPSSRKVPMVAAITRDRDAYYRDHYAVPSHMKEIEIYPR